MKHERQLICSIRFGFYGAKKLAARGYSSIATKWRAACRRKIAELRVLRGGGAA